MRHALLLAIALLIPGCAVDAFAPPDGPEPVTHPDAAQEPTTARPDVLDTSPEECGAWTPDDHVVTLDRIMVWDTSLNIDPPEYVCADATCGRLIGITGDMYAYSHERPRGCVVRLSSSQ